MKITSTDNYGSYLEKRVSTSALSGLVSITRQQFIEMSQRNGIKRKLPKTDMEDLPKSIDDLDDIPIEVCCFLVISLIRRGDLVLLAAEQKAGKTLIALTLAMIVASSGSIGKRLTACNAEKILYLDREMPSGEMLRRIKSLMGNFQNQSQLKKNFSYLRGGNDKGYDLSTTEGQQRLLGVIPGIKFLVIDNLDKFVPASITKSERGWDKVSRFLRSISDLGITVLVVHHLNKSGVHRGTGKITDDVDLVLNLSRPDDCPADKTKMVCSIADSRYLYGEQRNPFTVEFETQDEVTTVTVEADGYEAATHILEWVTKEEIDMYALSELMVDILKAARISDSPITAGMFIDNTRYGRGKTSVTIALNKLCELNLLHKEGSGSGTTYSAVPASGENN